MILIHNMLSFLFDKTVLWSRFLFLKWSDTSFVGACPPGNLQCFPLKKWCGEPWKDVNMCFVTHFPDVSLCIVTAAKINFTTLLKHFNAKKVASTEMSFENFRIQMIWKRTNRRIYHENSKKPYFAICS